MRFVSALFLLLIAACSAPGGGPTDASAPEAAGPPLDAGSDAHVVNNGPDALMNPPNEAGALGTCAPPPNACAPESSSGFSPAWHPPAPHQAVCTTQMMDDLWAGCLAPDATQASCDGLTGPNGSQAYKSCFACLVSSSSAPSYGAVVEYPDYIWFNVPGCVALADSASASCAMALQADDQCAAYACIRHCPITDDATYKTFLGCLDQADMIPCACKSYGDATSCANSVGQSAAQCFNQGPDKVIFDSIAPVFCGM